MCGRCGRPFLVLPGITRPADGLCRDDYYAFDLTRSYGVYNDALHHLILQLKYEVTCLGDWFAARLAEVIEREAEEFPRGRGSAGVLAS